MTSDRRVVLLTPAGNPVRHGGSGSAYANYGCRCVPCTEANRVRVVRRRAERSADDPGVAHGTRGGYINWGCRCVPCTRANSAYRREKVVD